MVVAKVRATKVRTFGDDQLLAGGRVMEENG